MTSHLTSAGDTSGDLPSSTPSAGAAFLAPMQHLLSARTVVGAGADTVLLEVKGNSVRIKRRGAPDVYVPLAAAAEVARFLMLASGAAPVARA